MQLEKRPDIRPYEVVILMHPDASEDEQKALFKKNKSIIEEQFGGKLNHLDTWGKRNLANSIAKNKKAVFFHSTFTAQPSAIAELERTMRINDKVLRFMHTSLDERTELNRYVENFKKSLAESAAREKEREAKFQARKAQRSGVRRDDAREFTRGLEDDMGIEGDADGEDEI